MIDTQIVHEGWGRFLIASFRLPDGRIIRHEIEDHGSAVAVLAYDVDRRVAMMVKQFRPPVFMKSGASELLEIIAGGLEESNEGITVVEIPLIDLAAMADSGTLTDLKSYAAVQALRIKHPVLFT